ncbi:hypothetical protein, partial [Clavibacter michiganensis]|uniref:hypothetical protein n=1 Tax=Clavibacter michiganensis TaxID=28447 RepID=UPI00292FAA34
PIRTVLFTGLTKYDGTRMRQLNAREFHQIAGRGLGGAPCEGAPARTRGRCARHRPLVTTAREPRGSPHQRR